MRQPPLKKSFEKFYCNPGSNPNACHVTSKVAAVALLKPSSHLVDYLNDFEVDDAMKVYSQTIYLIL